MKEAETLNSDPEAFFLQELNKPQVYMISFDNILLYEC